MSLLRELNEVIELNWGASFDDSERTISYNKQFNMLYLRFESVFVYKQYSGKKQIFNTILIGFKFVKFNTRVALNKGNGTII